MNDLMLFGFDYWNVNFSYYSSQEIEIERVNHI